MHAADSQLSPSMATQSRFESQAPTLITVSEAANPSLENAGVESGHATYAQSVQDRDKKELTDAVFKRTDDTRKTIRRCMSRSRHAQKQLEHNLKYIGVNMDEQATRDEITEIKIIGKFDVSVTDFPCSLSK